MKEASTDAVHRSTHRTQMWLKKWDAEQKRKRQLSYLPAVQRKQAEQRSVELLPVHSNYIHSVNNSPKILPTEGKFLISSKLSLASLGKVFPLLLSTVSFDLQAIGQHVLLPSSSQTFPCTLQHPWTAEGRMQECTQHCYQAKATQEGCLRFFETERKRAAQVNILGYYFSKQRHPPSAETALSAFLLI